MGAHCARRGATVRTMDDSHYRRPGKPPGNLPTVCLGTAESSVRRTLQRLLTCNHSIADGSSATDYLVDRAGRRMGARRAMSCTGAGFPPAHPRTTNLAGRDRSDRRAQHSPIKARRNGIGMDVLLVRSSKFEVRGFRNLALRTSNFEPPISGQ